MKRSILAFAALALVLTFTSCKETTAKNEEAVENLQTESGEVEKLVPEVSTGEEIPVEEEIDSSLTSQTVVEDHTAPVE